MNYKDMLKPLTPDERKELEYWRGRFNQSVNMAQREINKISRHNQSVLANHTMRNMGIR